MTRIPIATAKAIAKQYDQDQVIIVTWSKVKGLTTVVTYGKTVLDCEQAAAGGNMVKKALGWPDDKCQAVPRRVRQKHQELL